MTYIVVNTDNSVDQRDGEPSIDDLVAALSPTVPDAITIPEIAVGRRSWSNGKAVWVNEEFIRLANGGHFERNVLGTMLALALGANPAPLAGPVVLTGLVLDPIEGYTPKALASDDVLVATELLTNSQRVLAGDPETLNQLPRQILHLMREAQAVAQRPFAKVSVTSFPDIESVLGALGKTEPR
jgi:hypothetical protein